MMKIQLQNVRRRSSVGTWINLPYGGKDAGFDAKDLVAHVAKSGCDYIIQGRVACVLAGHPKPSSLDVWLRRNYTDRKDMKQAVNQVVPDLVATGLFDETEKPRCPDSGRGCKGLRLTTAGRELAGQSIRTPR